MVDPNAVRIHKKSVIVEGHRDVFEKFHLEKQGHVNPVLNVTVPRLKKANISTTFYAICGDSLTHVRGTYRYLNSALENIDALRQEIAVSQGQMKLILNWEDLPTEPTPNCVHFVLSFEGGRPLEGRLEHLRNFYQLGLRAMQITWNLRNELADGVKEERTGGGLLGIRCSGGQGNGPARHDHRPRPYFTRRLVRRSGSRFEFPSAAAIPTARIFFIISERWMMSKSRRSHKPAASWA